MLKIISKTYSSGLLGEETVESTEFCDSDRLPGESIEGSII